MRRLFTLAVVIFVTMFAIIYTDACKSSAQDVRTGNKNSGENTVIVVKSCIFQDDSVRKTLCKQSEKVREILTDQVNDRFDEIEAAPPEFAFDFDLLVRVVGAESRSECPEMQMEIAQCIQNRMILRDQTMEEVVSAPNQFAAPLPQGYDGGEMVNESCLRVFACGEKITDEPVTYFYSTAGGFFSAWHEKNLVFVNEIPNSIGGTTRFFKEVER